MESLSESVIIPQEDFIHNFNQWSKSNPLWITGASGDGKSTLAKKLASDHNAIIISGDYILTYMRLNPDEFYTKIIKLAQKYSMDIKNPIFREYIMENPRIPRGLKYSSVESVADEIIKKEMIRFFKWVYHKISTDRRYQRTFTIIESCDICYIEPEFFIDKPLIILGGSRLRSFYRRVKRENPENIMDFIQAVFKHIKKYRSLNYRLDAQKDDFRKRMTSITNESGLEDFILNTSELKYLTGLTILDEID